VAPTVLTAAYGYVGAYDFTGDSDKLMVAGAAVKKPVTTFRSQGWEESKKGLRSTSVEMTGHAGFEQGGVDEQLFTYFGEQGISQVGTFGPAETEGELAWMAAAGVYEYGAGAAVGEVAPMKLAGTGRDRYGLVRGTLLKKMAAVNATGATGTGVQVGAVAADQFLYGSFHLLGTPGTTITAVVESAAANTFSGATTRLTFGPLTAVGGTWATRVAGAITNTWWRLRVTAITGTWTVAAAIGIQ
jgi:hypothetical protein